MADTIETPKVEASKENKFDVLRNFQLQEAPATSDKVKEAEKAAKEAAKKAGGEYVAPEVKDAPEGEVKSYQKGDVFESDKPKRIAALQEAGKISKTPKE